MKRGYVKIWRCIKDNHFWQDKPFDRGRAWIDLLMLANYADGFIRSRGISIMVKRGQVGWSEVSLSERWGWSRGKVRRFLVELRNKEQIEQQNNNVTSLITIVNYDLYQMDSTTDGTASGTTDGQQTDSKQYPKKKLKKEENKKITSSGDEDCFLTKKKRTLKGKRLETFIRFWDAFNLKKGKAEAADAWLDIPLLTDKVVEQIVIAAQREASGRQKKVDKGITPKMAQGWITGRRWEDESEEVEAWKII